LKYIKLTHINSSLPLLDGGHAAKKIAKMAMIGKLV
jgi:hypothetical protein